MKNLGRSGLSALMLMASATADLVPLDMIEDEEIFRKAIDECPIDHNHCLPGFQCKTCGYVA